MIRSIPSAAMSCAAMSCAANILLMVLFFQFSLMEMTLINAADWSQFRGSRGDGISPVDNLPVRWSATEHIRWRADLPGEGWSSPVVIGSKIYLSAAILSDATKADSDRHLELLIVDAKSGKLEKQTRLFTELGAKAAKIHSKNSHASPTPLVERDRIFIHFGHLGTACTSLEGEVIWRNDQLAYPPRHGNGGSPVIVDDALIFSQDGEDAGKVIALNAKNGKLLWEVPRKVEATKKFSFCTPLVMTAGGVQQLILPGSNVVQSLDPATGTEIWRVRYDGYSVVPRPIVAQGLVMVCTGYDRPSLLAIRPDGRGDVTDSHVVWQTNVGVPNTPSLNTLNGLLFMISDKGIATCLEASTGKEVWKERIGGNFSASPLLAGETLYLLSEEGETTVLKAAHKYTEIARNKLGERTLASMAVVDNDLLIRTAKSLLRVSR